MAVSLPRHDLEKNVVLYDLKPFKYFILCVESVSRKLRTVLIYFLVFLLVFFWTVPVAFTSTLVELQNLTKIAPFLKSGERAQPFSWLATPRLPTYWLPCLLLILCAFGDSYIKKILNKYIKKRIWQSKAIFVY